MQCAVPHALGQFLTTPLGHRCYYLNCMIEDFTEQELSVGCLHVRRYQVEAPEFEARPSDFRACPLTHYAILPDVYIYATDS